MKIPPAVLVVIAVLTAAAGTLGYVAGSRQATLSETDVIAAYAQRYVDAQGLDASALRRCHAVPGADARVWLVVVCAKGSPSESAYFIGHGGALLHEGKATDTPFATRVAPEA
ncbi:MAG: hypothetical protein LPK02_06095 [Rhodobacterales bacterium]|nr:hypothetical protein [Rhodobacterales bacterium]